MKSTHYAKPISFTLECKRVINTNKFDQQSLIFTPIICDQNKKTFEYIHKREMSFASQIFNKLNLSDKSIQCHGSNKLIKIQKFAHENDELFVFFADGQKQTFIHNDFKTLKIKHKLNTSDKNIFNKKTNLQLSIDDICELSKSEIVKVNITMSMYIYCPLQSSPAGNTIYVSGKIKNMKFVSADMTTLVATQSEPLKKVDQCDIIIAPKQSAYIPMYTSKKNTIVNNIVDIIKKNKTNV